MVLENRSYSFSSNLSANQILHFLIFIFLGHKSFLVHIYKNKDFLKKKRIKILHTFP